jgi:hypothetical protein
MRFSSRDLRSAPLGREAPVRQVFLWSLVLTGAFGACATGADPTPKPADLIVGRWQGEGGTFTLKRPGQEDKVYTRKASFEFRKDGTFTFTESDLPELKDIAPGSVKGLNVTGKYSFPSDTEIETVAKLDGKENTTRAQVTVTKDELTVTLGKHKQKYKRTKE